jgi:hypothetical protein
MLELQMTDYREGRTNLVDGPASTSLRDEELRFVNRDLGGSPKPRTLPIDKLLLFSGRIGDLVTSWCDTLLRS